MKTNETEKIKDTIKIMIVEDHMIFRESLSTLINLSQDYQVIHKAGNGRKAIAYLENIDSDNFPDIILMDLFMEEEGEKEPDGLRTSRYIFKNICKKDTSKIRIIILSSSVSGLYISLAHDMNIQGYIAKDSDPNEIFNAIDVVMRNEMYYRNEIYTQMSLYKQENRWESETIIPPSAIELQILKLTSKGLTSREISEIISMNVDAVEAHKRQLLRKFDAKNVAELISIAFRIGYLKLY